MQELIDIAFSFPTLVFTVCLGFVLVFWLFAGLGAVDSDALPSGGGGGGPLSTVLAALGLTTVPATVLLSFFAVFGWFATVVGNRWLVSGDAPSNGAWLLLAAAVVVAVPPTVVVSKPFGRVFMNNPAQLRSTLVGRVCEIRTGSISASFGQGEVLDDEGASLLVEVRGDPDNDLRSGDWAIIHTYDRDAEVFWVSRADESIYPR